MKILLIVLLILLPTTMFAAPGDKPNQSVIVFRNVSTSDKPSGCTVGELKRNYSFLFVCYSTSKWRRITLGTTF